jgi:hypothetical protein
LLDFAFVTTDDGVNVRARDLRFRFRHTSIKRASDGDRSCACTSPACVLVRS